MEKNIIVLNELGQKVSRTYPKRARGLVKSGRAEYVDDCTIRLTITLDPTISDDNTEDFSMSKVICFNSRDFQFDKTCQGNNVGSRMFITDSFGKNVEVFEIGNGGGDWTQICSEVLLDKESDYLFRFAMTRKSNSMDGGVSQFIIVPISGEEANDNDWENRYVFNLARGEYKPALNKMVDGKNIKVYEIPFNTHDIARYRFVFVEQFSVTRIFTPASNEAYESYPDADRSFFEETKAQFENIFPKDINVGQTLSGAAESLMKVVDKVSSTVVNTAKSAFSEGSASKSSYHGANLGAASLQSVLAEIDDGGSVKFYGCNISDDSDSFDCGRRSDGIAINALGCNLGGEIFGGFVTKIGDGSHLNCSGCNIGSFDGNIIYHGGPIDGARIILNGSNISESSFARLLSVLDSCVVDIDGAVINEEEGEYWYGNKTDGLVINAHNAVIPEKVLNKINAKFDEGCLLNR